MRLTADSTIQKTSELKIIVTKLSRMNEQNLFDNIKLSDICALGVWGVCVVGTGTEIIFEEITMFSKFDKIINIQIQESQ